MLVDTNKGHIFYWHMQKAQEECIISQGHLTLDVSRHYNNMYTALILHCCIGTTIVQAFEIGIQVHFQYRIDAIVCMRRRLLSRQYFKRFMLSGCMRFINYQRLHPILRNRLFRFTRIICFKWSMLQRTAIAQIFLHQTTRPLPNFHITLLLTFSLFTFCLFTGQQLLTIAFSLLTSQLLLTFTFCLLTSQLLLAFTLCLLTSLLFLTFTLCLFTSQLPLAFTLCLFTGQLLLTFTFCLLTGQLLLTFTLCLLTSQLLLTFTFCLLTGQLLLTFTLCLLTSLLLLAFTLSLFTGQLLLAFTLCLFTGQLLLTFTFCLLTGQLLLAFTLCLLTSLLFLTFTLCFAFLIQIY